MTAQTRSRMYVAIPALVIVAFTLGISLIYRTDSTPPWREKSQPGQIEVVEKSRGASAKSKGFPFSFIAYNVKNWLISTQNPEKSSKSKAAVIQLLVGANPGVIGLSEIGSIADVKEIQAMLKKSGVDMPYFHHTGGSDSVRHLAILSQFPIIAKEEPNLAIPGKSYSMQRGILDVTIAIDGQEFRFIGLHLKSKRNVPEFNQALVRIDEANHARAHIDKIFAENPEVKLVAYGDFNDTTRSLSNRAIFGTYRTPSYMAPVHVKDSRGESWTHFWGYQDIYSRIDFVTVSKALSRRIDKKSSRIIDDPAWEDASDHRPLLIRFK